MKPGEPTSVFRRVQVPPSVEVSSGQSRVIKADLIHAESRRRAEVLAASRTADHIVAEARSKAADMMRVAEASATQARSARIAEVEAELAEQLDHVSSRLGDAIASSVDAIYRAVFAADPPLAMAASIEIARKVLQHEVGCILRVNTLDINDHSLQSVSNGHRIETSAGTMQGTVILSGSFGEINVDARRLISDLTQDLRKAFRIDDTSDSTRQAPS